MEMELRASDMELTRRASALLKYEEYIQIREKYRLLNPRKYVEADTHRRIMQEATDLAKAVIAKGGTDEEVKNACKYMYICLDARKYRLNYSKARNDFRIDELIKKYCAVNSVAENQDETA